MVIIDQLKRKVFKYPFPFNVLNHFCQIDHMQSKARSREKGIDFTIIMCIVLLQLYFPAWKNIHVLFKELPETIFLNNCF